MDAIFADCRFLTVMRYYQFAVRTTYGDVFYDLDEKVIDFDSWNDAGGDVQHCNICSSGTAGAAY